MNIPGSTTNLGQGELDTPHLTLVAETVLANELQLGVTIIRTVSVFQFTFDLSREQAHAQWPVITDSRAASKGRRGTLAVLE